MEVQQDLPIQVPRGRRLRTNGADDSLSSRREWERISGELGGYYFRLVLKPAPAQTGGGKRR